jgi:hypothetical protein
MEEEMRYKVYHKSVMAFGFGDAPKTFKRDDYSLVAEIRSESLGDTFRITNHIDHDWTTNPEVNKMHTTHARSTSVGDIVEDENGDFHYCASFGWEDIKEDV